MNDSTPMNDSAPNSVTGFDLPITLKTDPDFRNVYLSLMVFNAAGFFLAFFLNFIAILTFVTTPSLRTSSPHILLLCLAVSDCCVGGIAQPVYFTIMYSFFTSDSGLFAKSYRVFSNAITPLMNVSLLAVTAVTIDRYLALWLHLRYKEYVTSKRTYIVVASIWAISIAWSVVLLSIQEYTLDVLDHVFSSIIIVLNIFIMTNISRAIRRLSAAIVQGQQYYADFQQHKKNINVMYYITITFIVCFCPFLITNTAVLIVQSRGNGVLFSAHSFTETLIMLNSVFNPIIYFWRIKEMRISAVKLVRKSCCTSQ